jgi:hypothetical protein
LAIPASADPAPSDDISALARITALASGKDDVTESARIAAEAQVDIFRIRKARQMASAPGKGAQFQSADRIWGSWGTRLRSIKVVGQKCTDEHCEEFR